MLQIIKHTPLQSTKCEAAINKLIAEGWVIVGVTMSQNDAYQGTHFYHMVKYPEPYTFTGPR